MAGNNDKVPLLEEMRAIEAEIVDIEDRIEVGLVRPTPVFRNDLAERKKGLLKAQIALQRMSTMMLCWGMWDEVATRFLIDNLLEEEIHRSDDSGGKTNEENHT